MRFLCSLVFVFLLFPQVAWASDVIATYVYADGSRMTLCVRDDAHVRMDTTQNSYVLLNGGKVYSVNRDEEGVTHVMNMSSMAGGMMSMFGGGDSEYEIKYTKTGKTERIAGYTGALYETVVYEDGKVVDRNEVVLCSHGDLKKATRGWVALTKGMTASNPQFDAMLEESEKCGYGGVLRSGNSLKLSSLKTRSLDSAYFELPSQSEEVAVPASSGERSVVKNDASEIGEEAHQATKDEIKEEVRDFIGSIFD